MQTFQVITDDSGKIVAVLLYCAAGHALKIAVEYARVLGCACYRIELRSPNAPQVGSKLNLNTIKGAQRATWGGFATRSED